MKIIQSLLMTFDPKDEDAVALDKILAKYTYKRDEFDTDSAQYAEELLTIALRLFKLKQAAKAKGIPGSEVRRLRMELNGARRTIEHMTQAISWLGDHDRQGTDHLEAAKREERGRKNAIEQAKTWAARAKTAEATLKSLTERGVITK